MGILRYSAEPAQIMSILHLSGELQREQELRPIKYPHSAPLTQPKQTCSAGINVPLLMHLDFSFKSCELEEWSAS